MFSSFDDAWSQLSYHKVKLAVAAAAVVVAVMLMLVQPGIRRGALDNSMALGVYRIATNAIQMQFSMTLERAVFVFALTIIMCRLSAMIAIRKVKTADPADVS